MRMFSLALCAIMSFGCMKKNPKSLDDIEREERLKELIENEDVFDDIPEDTGLEFKGL